MKKTSIIFGMVCLLSISVLNAQHEIGSCGTVGDLQEAFIPNLQQNIRWSESNPITFRSTQYIPIKFHIISKTDGTSGVKEARLLDQLAALNDDFADFDVQFYLKDCSFNYINNTTVFENHEATIGTIMKVNKDNGAINVFIPETADREDSNLGPVLGYYQKIAITGTGVFESDWVVVRKDEISKNSITLTHELGHYFTLAHPHRGWDSKPYDETVHGNPAPVRSPNGIFTELQDGSNCDEAGDLLCDTAPDYNFGISWTDCDFQGGVMDPNGDLVNPEEKLYMGYFNYCNSEDYFFSTMQKAAMVASLNSSERAYIRSGWTPGNEAITTNTTLEFPINDEKLPYFNDIPFSWSPVPGANKYLLEVSRFANFMEGEETFSLVVNSNTKVLDGLTANRKYFWRVRPFNCYDTNMNFSNNGSFITGTVTKVKEPEFVEGWTVGPNPVRSNASIQININSSEVFEGQLSWYSLDGRRIQTEAGHRFTNGDNRISLSTGDLSAGIYVLALETAAGRLTKRIAVLP